MQDRRGGCLGTLLQLLLLGWLFDWLQDNFGWGRERSCFGCGCGFVILLVFIYLVLATLSGEWRLFPF
jgi:hypothetical protein